MSACDATKIAETAIRANEILSRLRSAAKQHLAKGATLQKLGRDQIACHQGEAAGRFWLLLSGKIKLLKDSIKGLSLVIDLVLPNQLFGAVYCDDNPLYPCTALGMQPSELLSFRLKDLLADLDRNPALQKMLLADACHKLNQAEHMRAVGLEEAPVRIAHVLLEMQRKFGGVIPETRSTLAELAGTSVETAIRITKELARRGILNTGRGKIEIRS